MRNFLIVFRFELKCLFQKTSLKVATLIICIIMLGLTSVPTIMSLVNSKKKDPGSSNPTAVALIEKAAYVMEDANMVASEFFPHLVESNPVILSSEEVLRSLIVDRTYQYGFVIHSSSSYTMIVQDKASYDYSESVMTAALEKYQKLNNLKALGIDPLLVDQASIVSVKAQSIVLGKDSQQGMLFAYAFMIVVYMLILLYGTSVSTSVAREKDSRTMELLITSTKPRELMLGKVFASGMMGFLQVGVIVLTTILGFFVNKGNYPDFILAMLQGSMTLEVLITFLLFSISGYLLYLFIYAALGSLVSKVEDVTNAVTPITFLFVIAYFLASLAMNMPNSLITKVSSFIPFTSIFTMPIRSMLVSVSFVELLISLVIMLITTWFTAYLSIYIYRAGSLNYGNKMSLIKVFKELFKK